MPNGDNVLNDPVNLVDPEGLSWIDWKVWDYVEASGDFFAGFGDTLTSGFGLFDTSLTQMAREYLGSDGMVDKCSGSYAAGKWGAYAWGVTTAGAAAASALNNGIIINGTRVLQVHKHSLSMKILQNAGYTRKVAGALRNTPLWHANWGRTGHLIFRRLIGR